jgi:hypothetical protein
MDTVEPIKKFVREKTIDKLWGALKQVNIDLQNFKGKDF